MQLLRLFYISILKPILIYPIKITALMLCGITRIKSWSHVFNTIEHMRCSNRVAFWKTIYFNFRSLSFKQARNFPIHIFTDTQIISSAGNIYFKECNVTFGMIKWGWFHTYRSQGKTRIQNFGDITFKGGGKFLSGSETVVFPKADLTIGDHFFIGENALIYCQNKIYISTSVCISYQSDISDSDFHYCIDVNDGSVLHKSAPIYIGAYNWIANRTTIKKGTKTPHHIIVASSGSVLGKDYTTSVEPYSILGGSPAHVLKTGISRIWHDELNNIERIDKMINGKDSIRIPNDKVQKLLEL